MSSSLEDEFSPPDWATKEEVIKAARHYINYWKVEAQHRNDQWLDELEKRAKAMADATFIEAQRNLLKANLEKSDNAVWTLSVENTRLKAEVERLTDYLNKMNNTPEGVDYVEVDVGFWTKHGSRLPSSYKAFWSNAKGWHAAKQGGRP